MCGRGELVERVTFYLSGNVPYEKVETEGRDSKFGVSHDDFCDGLWSGSG